MSSPLDDSERLFAALRELPPRPARFLELRFVDQKSDGELAAFYGMSRAAWSVHLLRAARALTLALSSEDRPDVDYPTELAEADALQRALNTPEAAVEAKIAGPLKTVRQLQDNAQAVRRRLDQWAAVEAASPAAARETWIRRALVVALLAVTAFLYFTRNR